MYVSTRNADLSADAIEAIGQVAAKNNLELGITGFLVSVDQCCCALKIDQFLAVVRVEN